MKTPSDSYNGNTFWKVYSVYMSYISRTYPQISGTRCEDECLQFYGAPEEKEYSVDL